MTVMSSNLFVAEEPQSPASTSVSIPAVKNQPQAEPVQPRRLDGLDEAVAKSVQALCQVQNCSTMPYEVLAACCATLYHNLAEVQACGN